jgi:hypothetical protein
MITIFTVDVANGCLALAVRGTSARRTVTPAAPYLTA